MAKIHIHTKYSLLDAIIEPEALVQKCVEQGETALCVTEHGNVYSNVELYKLCKKYNIKYMYGCEMYICHDVAIKEKNDKYFHLVVIAKNEQGRLNLNKLVSKSCEHKYYGKPRIDFKMLVEHKEGLIILSACMAGEVQRYLMQKEYQKAKDVALQYKEVFGDDYYLEYQSHSEKTQQMLNRYIVSLAEKLGIKYVVTTDAHYLNKEEQKYHSIYVQIGQHRDTEETYNDCYVQSDEEILAICKSTTREENLKAIQTSNEIADKCNVELPLSAPIMPHNTPIPPEYKTEIEYLKHLCINGWYKKKIDKKPNKEEYKKRLAYEIDSIERMGFEGYFLLVDSYCNSVKRRGIARGSAGGSLVCYLTNITDIDPIEHKLYFERFIDVGALDLLAQGKITKKELKIPDVDSDFGKNDRAKVLDYVIERYGKDRVVSLGSFQYIWAKGAIKDIGKVLGIPFEITNHMTAQLNKETIGEALELGLLDNYKDKYPELFVYAKKLAGLPKSFSAHPCGKVIAMDDVVYYNAVDVNDDGIVILQGDMHTADDLGLIKADFLGLRTVDVIYDTLDMIGKDYEYIAPHNLDFNDKKVLENFRKGYTSGIFQFESPGMQGTLRKIECNSIYDLTVANALYRPGSMKYIDNYANRRKGLEEYEFLHPDLEPILKDSYGIIVFQEQLIEIGRLAKLSNPDELRKATAKKKADLLEKIKPELFNGLKVRGWSEEQLNQLWDSMLDFAKYSFNKSHAAAYAIIAYICMYLKTYHTKEFLCAWINSVSNKIDKISECVYEAKRLNIPIYLGKYNNCSPVTKVYQDGIMMGTNTFRDCNKNIANEIMSLGTIKGTFIDVLDNIKNHNLNIESPQLKVLIGLNFFSDFGNNKYLLSLYRLYNGIKEKSKTILPSFRECKTISKDKILNYTQYGITEFLIKKYSNKETAKQYSQIDNLGLLNELANKYLTNESMDFRSQIEFEMKYLNYTLVKYKIESDYLWVVINFVTYKCTTKPYITLYNLKTGEVFKTKISDSKVFVSHPFGLYSILLIENGFKEEYKKVQKIVGDKIDWVTSDDKEFVLDSYDVRKDII